MKDINLKQLASHHGYFQKVILLLHFILVPDICFADSSSSTNYILSRSIIDSGGSISNSLNFKLHNSVNTSSSLGDSISNNFHLTAGFITIADSDGDSIFDNTDNCLANINTAQLDTDNDTQGDVCDMDDDNDGLTDIVETVLNTNPLNPDSDNDGLSDFDETNIDGNPLDFQPGIDTDPNNPDTDGDNLNDGIDPNPLIPNSDGDLVTDGIINAADLLIAHQIANNLIAPSPSQLAHGDMYPPGAGDGVIDASDLILIQQLILNPL